MRRRLPAPVRFLIDLVLRFIADDGLASAGYLAYVGVMSMLPFIILVFTLLGLVGQADQGAGIVTAMFEFMPPEVAATLQDPVREVIGRASGGVLTLSIVVVLWISGSGVEGLRTALNRAYRTTETRSYWRLRGQSTLIVILFSGVIVVAVGCMIVGPVLWHQAEGFFDFGMTFGAREFPDVLRFGLGTAALFVFAAALYHQLPNHMPGWLDVLPGAGAVCVLTNGATSLLAFYLSQFAQYSVIYGSLGGVICTLVYFYLLGAIFILGAEFNAFLASTIRAARQVREVAGEGDGTRV